MEEAVMKVLLQKYWEAEATVEEERQLAEYCRQPGIGPEWETVRALFEWREDEAEVRPGADFDERMLRRIKEMEGGGARRIRLTVQFAAAASLILCLGIGLLIPATSPKKDDAGRQYPAASAAVIKDTYTDPQQALAAVRHALLVASVHMNEGKQITQKNIDRLHNTWQVATGQKKQL